MKSTSELSELKIAYSNKVSEMGSEIEKQRELIVSLHKSFDEMKKQMNNSFNETTKAIENERAMHL